MNTLITLSAVMTFLMMTSNEPLHAGEKKFYRSGSQAEDWAKANPTRIEAVLIAQKIAAVPQFIWLAGESLDGLSKDAQAAKSKGQILLILLYEIPGRDNGNYSAGGLSGPAA